MANYWGESKESHLSISSRGSNAIGSPVESARRQGPPNLGLPRPYLLHVHPSHSCLVPISPGDKCSGNKFTVISETDPDGTFRLPANRCIDLGPKEVAGRDWAPF